MLAAEDFERQAERFFRETSEAISLEVRRT